MKKVIFMRIPKTASTNFTGVLKHIYRPKIISDLVWREKPEGIRTRTFRKGGYIYDFETPKYPAKNMRLYNAIEGHFLAEKYKSFKDEYSLVTFIRDPIERVISHFNLAIERQDKFGIDIKRFAEIYRNFQSIMVGDINDFDFVGITEMFTFSVGLFYNQFNIPKSKRMDVRGRTDIRTVGTKRLVTKEERTYIRKINKKDFEMYNSVKKRLVKLQKGIRK